jgi:hypothetical protein
VRVRTLAARGASKAGIASALRVSRDVLARWFEERPELAQAYEHGRARVETRLVSKLLEKALAGDTVSLLFALKCMYGWREGDGGEQANRVSITFTLPGALTRDQWAQVIEQEATRDCP